MLFSAFGSTAVLALSVSFSATSQAQAHRRVGLYVQAGLGLGRPIYSDSSLDNYGMPEQRQSNSQGASLTGSLLVGGAIRPGLVLGGGVLGALSFNSPWQITLNGKPFDEEHNGPWGEAFALVGPFVDWYPSRTLGFHAQALGGLAVHDTDTPITRYGLAGGLGYDVWIGENWSAGVLARLTFSRSGMNMPSSVEHLAMIAPSLEATFTFH